MAKQGVIPIRWAAPTGRRSRRPPAPSPSRPGSVAWDSRRRSAGPRPAWSRHAGPIRGGRDAEHRDVGRRPPPRPGRLVSSRARRWFYRTGCRRVHGAPGPQRRELLARVARGRVV